MERPMSTMLASDALPATAAGPSSCIRLHTHRHTPQQSPATSQTTPTPPRPTEPASALLQAACCVCRACVGVLHLHFDHVCGVHDEPATNAARTGYSEVSGRGQRRSRWRRRLGGHRPWCRWLHLCMLADRRALDHSRHDRMLHHPPDRTALGQA